MNRIERKGKTRTVKRLEVNSSGFGFRLYFVCILSRYGRFGVAAWLLFSIIDLNIYYFLHLNYLMNSFYKQAFLCDVTIIN